MRPFTLVQPVVGREWFAAAADQHWRRNGRNGSWMAPGAAEFLSGSCYCMFVQVTWAAVVFTVAACDWRRASSTRAAVSRAASELNRLRQDSLSAVSLKTSPNAPTDLVVLYRPRLISIGTDVVRIAGLERVGEPACWARQYLPRACGRRTWSMSRVAPGGREHGDRSDGDADDVLARLRDAIRSYVKWPAPHGKKRFRTAILASSSQGCATGIRPGLRRRRLATSTHERAQAERSFMPCNPDSAAMNKTAAAVAFSAYCARP